jgi:hypothetical protein
MTTEHTTDEGGMDDLNQLAELIAETTPACGVDRWAVEECGLSPAEWAAMTKRARSTVLRNVRRASMTEGGWSQPSDNDAQRTKYTRDELIEYLRAYHDEFDERPTARDLRASADLPSHETYRSQFGAWENALEAAGFNTRSSSVEYDRDELLEYLHTLEARLGHEPTYEEMESADDTPAVGTYQDRFGSWSDALEAAGYSGHRRASDFSLDGLIDAIIAVYEELGSWPSTTEYDEHRPEEAMAIPTFYQKSPGGVSSWETVVNLAKQQYSEDAG